jgi:bacillithiol system protein YtxJ
MNWIELERETQLEEIKRESINQPVLLFKHSTTCSISSMAINRLERSWKAEEMGGVKAYYLDLHANRGLSRRVADVFDVMHESPQVLLIRNGECVYHASHMGISYPEVKNTSQKLQ